MQFYRRLVSVALLVLLVSSAVAFGESVKLTFMTFGPDSLLDAYREAIEIFEAENPGVTIDFQPATGPVDLKDKALVAFAGGIGPDLIGGDDSVAYALIDGDCLLEVSELVANDPEIEQVRNSLLPGLWEMSLYSGKRYTIPMSVALADWYLNIDHFESSGLALPDEDWTWDDFLSLARRLVVYDGDKMVRGAYAVQANALHEILPWMIQAGGLPFDDWAAPTKATFSSPEVTEAMQFLYDLRWEYGVAPKPWELTGGTITMFMLGEVSMLTHWPARVGQFAREGVGILQVDCPSCSPVQGAVCHRCGGRCQDWRSNEAPRGGLGVLEIPGTPRYPADPRP
ncbi:MAG TPA: extracellular solute-binding protein [Firmicutes bacterium]|nr:extracellular solute-binding protein [Bacillota bacterium]